MHSWQLRQLPSLQKVRRGSFSAKGDQMTDKPRGRPKTIRTLTIQKHIFIDQATAEMLKQMANGNESGYIRELIRAEYTRLKG